MRRLARFVAAVVVGGCAVLLAPAAAHATPGPSSVPEYWFDWWNVPALWQAGADGRGITIGEIDTGVNASWPALASDVLSGTDFGAGGGNGQTDHEIDPFGHGTAMASIMVAQNGQDGIEGLAPGAKLLPIAIPLNGTDDASNNDHLGEAIRYAADHGAKIISMSLGGEQDPSVDSTPCDDDLQAAITYAISKGSIVVAAAGNSGLTGSPVEEPGVCLGVVAVAAVDSSRAVADFSSRHPYVDLAAPGVNIPTLGRIVGQTYVGDGTSQATAVTSAALALVWSKFPSLTNSQIVARVLATVDSKHATRDPAYGYGLINPSAAISANVAATTDDPIFDAVAPYIAVQNAGSSSSADRAPAPAKVVAEPPGQFDVGSPPGQLTSPVVTAFVVSLLALLAFVLLLVGGVRRRRHAVAYGGAPDGYGAPYPSSVPPPPVPLAPGDPNDQWREVVAQPQAWNTPPVPAPPAQWAPPPGQWAPPPAEWAPTPAQVPPPPEWTPPSAEPAAAEPWSTTQHWSPPAEATIPPPPAGPAGETPR